MPPNLSKQDSQFSKELKKFAHDFNAIIVARYILLSGDGYSTYNSWQHIDDWNAVDTELSRATWFPVTTDGVGTKHLVNILVPASEIGSNPAPAVGQRLELQTPGGVTLNPQYNIHYVNKLRGNREVYAYQIVAESIQ